MYQRISYRICVANISSNPFLATNTMQYLLRFFFFFPHYFSHIQLILTWVTGVRTKAALLQSSDQLTICFDI